MELGICPKCGSESLEYGTFDIEGVFYPVSCKCGYEGKEYYNLEFTHYEED